MFRPRGKERGGGGNWLNKTRKEKRKEGGWLIAPVAFASCLPFLLVVLEFLFHFLCQFSFWQWFLSGVGLVPAIQIRWIGDFR
jgi:hypothetical protein